MKQWARKLLIFLSCVTLGASSAFGFVGCKKNKPTDSSNNSGSVTECTQHTWNDGEVTKKATCVAKGEKTYTCTKCSATKTEEVAINPNGHTYKEESKEAATCVLHGMTTYTCQDCQYSYSEVSETAKGHALSGCTWTQDVMEVDNCQYQAVEKTTCPTCKVEIVRNVGEAYTKHESASTSIDAATCMKKGTKTIHCNSCNATETEEIAIDAKAHAWDDGSTEGGITTYHCTHAGCSETRTTVSAKSEISATISASAIKEAGEVELQNAAIKLPDEVKSQLGNGDVTMEAKEADLPENVAADIPDGAPVYDFSIETDNGKLSSFAKKITVTVPYTLEYGMDPDEVCVYYIDNDGKIEAIEAKYYEVNGNGFATFETDHFSLYTIVRLTAEQRCAAYGHKYETKTVAATCGVEGYTVEICSVCKNAKPRTNFTAARTHEYEASVIAPTCSEMGYSVYTCKHCKDVYISDYTDKTAHSYVDTVTQPTCTAEGYTTHTCSVCHYSCADSYVAAKGHTYQNGACSACGKKDPNAATNNFYYNMVESLFTADSYYLEASNVIIDMAYTYSNGDAETQNYKLALAQLQIGFDETGLVGKGEGTLVGEMKLTGHTKSEQEALGQVKVVFRDGKMYVYMKSVEGSETQEGYYVMPIAFGEVYGDESGAIGTSMMTEMIGEMLEPLTNLLSALGAQDNSKANQLLGKLIEYCFEKKATADGYTFTLNTKRATEIYKAVKDSTVSQLFDTVFGKGAFAATQSYLVASVNKTIPTLVEEATTELAKWGITKEALFATINQIVNTAMGEAAATQPFDIATLLGQMKDITIAQLLQQIFGSMLPENTDFAELINNTANSIKDVKIFELAKASEEQIAAIDETMAMVENILKQIPVTFTTDKSGAVLSVSVETNGLKPIDNTGKVLGENGVYELLNVTVDGTMKFVVGGSYAGAYEDVVKAAETIEKAYAFDSNIDGEDFKTFVIEDSVFLWAKNTLRPTTYTVVEDSEVIEETHNGKLCTKKSIWVENLYKKGYSSSIVISATKDCNGWFVSDEYYWQGGEYTCYAWFDANGNIVDISDLDYRGFIYGLYTEIAYNATTGKYALGSQHNYVFVKKIAGEGCFKDTEVYKCTICGAYMTEGGYESHDDERFVELLPGSTTCEDGVLIGWKCVDCGRVTSSDTIHYHGMFSREHVIENTSETCGNITFVWNECACGEKISCYDYDWIYGNAHMFRYNSENIVNEETHTVDVTTYTCGVEGCGYTVTETTEWTWDKANCKATRKFIYVFGDNDWKFEYTVSFAYHSEKYTNKEITNKYGTGYRHTETCTECNEILSDETKLYDSYYRETYYENHLSEDGWYKVFNGCDYTKYSLDGEEWYSDTDHVWEYVSSDEWSCTQYREQGNRCKCCGKGDIEYIEPDRYGWSDGHSWYYDEYSEEYVCGNCGTHSHYGVDGIISLEDMRTEDAIKVGYFNFREWNIDYNAITEECPIDIDIVVNYDPDPDATRITLSGEGLFTKTVTSPEDGYSEKYGYYVHYRESGIVTVDTAKLKAALETCGATESKSISVVFSVPERFLFEDKKDSDTYQECALTFSIEELFGTDNGDDSYEVEYGGEYAA